MTTLDVRPPRPRDRVAMIVLYGIHRRAGPPTGALLVSYTRA